MSEDNIDIMIRIKYNFWELKNLGKIRWKII